MAKKQATHSVAKNGQQQIVQTSFEEDDNLLPKPEELQKYIELDPDFMNWIKDRCDIEQRARIKHRDDNVSIVKSTNNKLFTIDILSLVLSTTLMSLLIYLSYRLIMNGHEEIGTVLGSASVIVFAVRILNFRRPKPDK